MMISNSQPFRKHYGVNDHEDEWPAEFTRTNHHIPNSPLGTCSQAACDSGISVGVRVIVLEGRRFQDFGAGDRGIVVHVDREACTCDVAFDGRGGLTRPVAIRHLGPEPPCKMKNTEMAHVRGGQTKTHPFRDTLIRNEVVETLWTSTGLNAIETARPASSTVIPDTIGTTMVPMRESALFQPSIEQNMCGLVEAMPSNLIEDKLRLKATDYQRISTPETSDTTAYETATTSNNRSEEKEIDALADAVQASAYATATATSTAMLEVSYIRVAVNELRELITLETEQRIAGVQKLEKGMEQLRVGVQTCKEELSRVVPSLQLAQQHSVDSMMDHRTEWTSRWKDRFDELTARVDELTLVQASCAQVGAFEKMSARIDALQKEITNRATQEFVEEWKRTQTKSMKTLLLQVEQHFKNFNNQVEIFKQHRTHLDNVVEASCTESTRSAEQAAQDCRQEAQRRQDAETTLGKLLNDLNGIRTFTNSSPAIVPSFGMQPGMHPGMSVSSTRLAEPNVFERGKRASEPAFSEPSTLGVFELGQNGRLDLSPIGFDSSPGSIPDGFQRPAPCLPPPVARSPRSMQRYPSISRITG